MFRFIHPTKFHFYLSVVSTMLVTGMALAHCSLAQETSPEFYLQKYREYLDAFSVLSFTSDQSDYNEINPNPENVNVNKYDYAFDFHRGAFYSKSVDDRSPENIRLRFYDTKNPIFRISYIPSEEKIQDRYHIISWLTPPSDVGLRSILSELYLFGYFRNGLDRIFIPEILDGAQKEITIKNGEPWLHATTNEYEFDILFNLDKGYVPETIQIRRLQPSNSPEYADYREYHVTEYQEVNEKWFPRRFNTKESFPGGYVEWDLPPGVSFGGETGEYRPPETNVAQVEISDVQIYDELPDHFFNIPFKIPNGIPVTMQDAYQIKYVWMDGKIVPLTDELALQIAKSGHKFIPGPGEPRFWMILLGLIAVILAGGWKIYLFWTSDKE